MELKGKTAHFLGDSITAGVGVSCPEHIYYNILKEECGLAEVRNYGISGTRIARQPGDVEECGAALSVRYSEMKNADINVIFGGSNDFGYGIASIGTYDDRTPDTYYGGWHTLLSGLIAKDPDSTIVVMTPLHRDDDFKPSIGNGKTLKVYSDIAKEIAEYYSVPVLDLYALSGIQPCIPIVKEKYCPDGLHPNDEGHKIIASRLIGFLRSL